MPPPFFVRLVTPQRLYPVWCTPWLPLPFATSAVRAGLMVIVLVKIFWAHWYDRVSVFATDAKRSGCLGPFADSSLHQVSS